MAFRELRLDIAFLEPAWAGNHVSEVTLLISDEELDYYLDKKKINDFKYYNENYEYISPKEKIQIDNKFTKPRNKSQKKYMEILKQKGNLLQKIL